MRPSVFCDGKSERFTAFNAVAVDSGDVRVGSINLDRVGQQAIRRGTFRSVKELVDKIDRYVQSSKAHAQPFVWTASADSILAKVQRLCERISGTEH